MVNGSILMVRVTVLGIGEGELMEGGEILVIGGREIGIGEIMMVCYKSIGKGWKIIFSNS
jgi:hypothetical protein